LDKQAEGDLRRIELEKEKQKVLEERRIEEIKKEEYRKRVSQTNIEKE
jgi:hypothetical protein